MNRLEINPNNEKYYSKEFMQGYKCGIRCQSHEDMKVLEQIRDEIDSYCSDNRDRNDGLYIAMRIIDKYKNNGENND